MELSKCLGCMEDLQDYPCPHCGYDPTAEKRPEYALPQGTILAGKYLLGKVLGQGGFGITYIGWDIALERKVAIKEYYPSGQVSRSPGTLNLTWYTTEQAMAARQDGMQMFLKEARKMVKADSIPGIVRVLDLFQENGTAYIVMEFVEGITLKEYLLRGGPLSWAETERIFQPVVRSMEQVHSSGLIHRDLSPDNLMLTPDGSVKILDLGAAKDLSLNSGVSSMQVAKNGFSPLEQYIQRGGSGPWTDVYSIAATIYYTLTGILPPSAVERLEKDTISWDTSALKALPSTVLTALQKAMAVQVNDRTLTMEALETELFTAAAPKPAPEEKPHKKLNVPSPKSSQPKVRWLPVTAALLILVCIFVLGSNLVANTKKTSDGVQETAQKAVETQPSTTADTSAGKLKNRMRSDYCEFNWQESTQRYATFPVFGSQYTRDQIRRVVFLSSLDSAESNAWDISEASDGSVLAWTHPESGKYVLYIAANGKVKAPEDSYGLFALYENMVQIDFNDVFDTSDTTDMSYMFTLCTSLKEIDVSSFDTGNAREMSCMFSDCTSMKSLDLRNFKFPKNVNTDLIFDNCTALDTLYANDLHISPVETYYDENRKEFGSWLAYPLVFRCPLVQCKELTISLSVDMNAGAKCEGWTIYARVNGTFKDVGVIQLSGGVGSITQTVRFDTPLSMDQFILIPKAPGNYSFDWEITVLDALVGVSQ